MKKILLFSLIFFLSALCVFAYETIIINFPDGEKWDPVYYKKVGNEALLQYVPKGETSDIWTRSVVVHSYNHSAYPMNTFIANNVARLQKANPTAKYKTIRMRETDAIVTRCTNDYGKIKGQCEFFRATFAHDGIVTIHYMNKNRNNFMANYTLWLEIVKKAKLYNTFYRTERMLNKAEYFEL